MIQLGVDADTTKVTGSYAVRGVGALCCAFSLLLATVIGIAPVAAAMDPPALAAPTDQASVSANPEFTWAEVTDAASYRLQISAVDTFSPLTYSATVFGPRADVPTDLPLGTEYWRVASVDANGVVSSYTAAREFTKTAAPGPTLLAPLSSAPDAEVTDTASVSYPSQSPILKWSRVAGVKNYEVQLDTSDHFSTPTTTTTVGDSYVPTSALTVGTVYYWRVRANSSTTGSGTTQWSQEGSFRLDWQAGAAPELVTPADNAVVQHVELRWKPRAGVASYKLQISVSPDFIPVSTTDYAVNGSRFTPTANFDATTRYWHVASVSPNGSVSPYSATRTLTRSWTGTDGLFARPNNVRAVGSAATDLVIKWDPVPEASRYEIAVTENVSGVWTPVDCLHNSTLPTSCVTTQTELTTDMRYLATRSDTSLHSNAEMENGNTYRFQVRAIDETPASGSVYSQWSDAARFGGESAPGPLEIALVADPRTPTTAHEPAVQLAPADSADVQDNVTMSWSPVYGAQAYAVYFATDTNFTTTVTTKEGLLCAVSNTPPCAVFTKNTNLELPSQLPDNTAGQSYYWLVVPCYTVDDANSNWRCDLPSTAINQAGKFRSFRKVGTAPGSPATDLLSLDPDAEEGIRLSWTDTMAPAVGSHATTPDGGGTRYYRLQISKDPEFTNDNLSVLDSNIDQPFYVPDIGLDPTTYYWRVAAVDGSSSRLAWTAVQSFVHTRARLAAPVADQNITSPEPLLKWSMTTLSVSYQVETFNDQSVAVPTGSATVEYPAFTPIASLPAGHYTWRVRKIDNSGKAGPWDSEASPGTPLQFTIGTTAPALATPEDAAIVERPDLSLTWSRPPGAANFKVEVSTNSDFSSSYDTATVLGTAWAPTQSGGYAAGTYYWRVKATSNAASGTVLATSTPVRSFTVRTQPSKPTNQTLTVGTNRFSVTWAAPTDDGGTAVTGWVVRYRASGDDWINTEQDLALGSVTFTGIAKATTYDVQVAARNQVGLGTYATKASVSTPDVPGAPATLTVTPAIKGFHAVWGSTSNGGSTITGYVVEYRPEDSSGSWGTVAATKSPLDVSNLAADTSYDVRVKALNAVGDGAYATTQPISTYDGASAPSSFTAKAIDRGILLSWQPPLTTAGADVTNYRVQLRYESGQSWTSWSAANLDPALRSYQYGRLTNGRRYQVQLAAVTARGSGTPVGPATLTPAAIPGAPGWFTGVGAAHKIKLAWRASVSNGSALTRYVLQTSTDGTKWKTVARPTQAAISFTWTKPKPLVTYSIRLYAQNSVGAGPASKVINAKAS